MEYWPIAIIAANAVIIGMQALRISQLSEGLTEILKAQQLTLRALALLVDESPSQRTASNGQNDRSGQQQAGSGYQDTH